MSQAQSDNAHRNALKAGYELHWYQIKAVLGQGAFGITYLARDINLNRMVAIKEFLPGQYAMREGDDTVRAISQDLQDRFQWGLARFIEEARILDQFDHNNIVRVLNTFEANNTAYMVMRYEQGVSLKEILVRQKYLDESDLMNILFPILDGLDMMHKAGYIHRDIKPSNIFVRTDGTPVLLDFGSARQSMQIETHTLTSLVSPGYAPIEQYVSKSDKQGPWTDIYGMAATLYRAVTGVAPADAISRGEALTGNEKDTYIPCRDLADQRYSDQFVAAIDQGLKFLTRERPQTVGAWRELLRGAAQNDASNAAVSGHISSEVVEVVRDSLTQTATRVYQSRDVDTDQLQAKWQDAESTGTDQLTDTLSIDVAHKQGFHRGLKLVLGLLILFAGGFLVTNFEKMRDVDQQGYIADPEETVALMPAVEGEGIDPAVGLSEEKPATQVELSEPVPVPETMTNPLTESSLEDIGATENDPITDPDLPESEGQLLLTPVPNQATATLQPQYLDSSMESEMERVPEATTVSELPPGAVLIDEPIRVEPPNNVVAPSSTPTTTVYQAPASLESEAPTSQIAPSTVTATTPINASDNAGSDPKTIDNKTTTVTRDGVLIEEYEIPKRPEKPATLRSVFNDLMDSLSNTGRPESGDNEAIRERVDNTGAE